MAPIVSTIEISRPPAVVFAYATDPMRFKEWQDDVISGAMVGTGPPIVGARYTVNRQIGRSERQATFQITESEPPLRWAVRGIDGPIRAIAEVTIEPLDGGTRSRLTVSLDFEGYGIGKLLVPLVVRPQTRKISPVSYRHLKERLEKEPDQD